MININAFIISLLSCHLIILAADFALFTSGVICSVDVTSCDLRPGGAECLRANPARTSDTSAAGVFLTGVVCSVLSTELLEVISSLSELLSLNNHILTVKMSQTHGPYGTIRGDYDHCCNEIHIYLIKLFFLLTTEPTTP